jgi:hypothetical protein
MAGDLIACRTWADEFSVPGPSQQMTDFASISREMA